MEDPAITVLLNDHRRGPHFELLQTTRSAGWAGIAIDNVAASGGEVTLPKLQSYVIGMSTFGSVQSMQEVGGKTFRGTKTKGGFAIVPPGIESYWTTDRPHGYASIWLPPALLAASAGDLFDGAAAEVRLAATFDQRDPLVERLSDILIEELQRPTHPAQHLIYEGASLALIAHVIRAFSNVARPAAKAAGRLSARALEQIAQYVDDNLDAKITLDDLARIAGSSKFHFIKLFRNTLGVSPMSYLERSRIERAQELLRARRMTVAEVAFAVGFGDQSHFARRFRLRLGMTPVEYRRDYGMSVRAAS